MALNLEGEVGEAVSPNDQFSVLTAMLTAHRNKDENKFKKLSWAVESFNLSCSTWSEAEEESILVKLDEVYNNKLQQDIQRHQLDLAKRQEEGGALGSDKLAKRLRPPGAKPSLGLESILRPSDNAVVTDPKGIIKTINDHWSATFERAFDPNREVMQEWLRWFPRKFRPSTTEDWLPSIEDVEEARLVARMVSLSRPSKPFLLSLPK